MNGDAQGMLPMLAPGADAVMQRLRELAGRQRALAEQLERLQASGDASAAGALAQEARELARQLEAGRLVAARSNGRSGCIASCSMPAAVSPAMSRTSKRIASATQRLATASTRPPRSSPARPAPAPKSATRRGTS